MRCINCGRPTAEQRGENLSCPACGHRWTVEDEAANAHYIRAALGRDPILSAAKAPDAGGEARQVIEAEGQVEAVNDEIALSEMTVAELTVYADEQAIDLSGVRSARKEDIIARIQEALWEREESDEIRDAEPETPEE